MAILSVDALDLRRLILGSAAESLTKVVGWTYWCRGNRIGLGPGRG